MSDFSIRPANKSDAADLAILDNLAGHGIPVIFWQELTENNRLEDAIAIGKERLADDNGFYNWKKARVATDDDQVIGMQISYIMPKPDEEAEAIKQNSTPLKPVFELYALSEGHWFIDALAVYPSHQNLGAGKLLFEDSIDKGEDSIADTMSVIVEDTNETAFKLYRQYGFEVVDQCDFIPFEGALEINEWLLMSRSFR